MLDFCFGELSAKFFLSWTVSFCLAVVLFNESTWSLLRAKFFLSLAVSFCPAVVLLNESTWLPELDTLVELLEVVNRLSSTCWDSFVGDVIVRVVDLSRLGVPTTLSISAEMKRSGSICRAQLIRVPLLLSQLGQRISTSNSGSLLIRSFKYLVT